MPCPAPGCLVVQMRHTVSGWLSDAEEILEDESSSDLELHMLATLAVAAIGEVMTIHHKLPLPMRGKKDYCMLCQDIWPCDTVRRVAKALEVRT